MSDLRKQWAIAQQRPRPLSPAETRRIHEACESVGIGGYGIDAAYAALVATLPRPIEVFIDGRHPTTNEAYWAWICGLETASGATCSSSFGHTGDLASAVDAALRHLYDAHGCPNRHTTGEPCDTACIHCHGWQWCAQPSERREL